MRNPPALLERLRRAGIRVKLDETPQVSEATDLYLPYVCFQEAVKSELPIETSYQFKRSKILEARTLENFTRQKELLEATKVSTDSVVMSANAEVENALRSLKGMLPGTQMTQESPAPSYNSENPSFAPLLTPFSQAISTSATVPHTPQTPQATAAGFPSAVTAQAADDHVTPFLAQMKDTR